MKKLKQPKQTIIKLEDNEAGHAAGWDPPNAGIFSIFPPFKIEQGMSFEFTSIDPLPEPPNSIGGAKNCILIDFRSDINRLTINCGQFPHPGSEVPSEGAVLTYIMSK